MSPTQPPPKLLTSLPAYQTLQSIYTTQKSTPTLTLRSLFDKDPQRFEKLSRAYESTYGPPTQLLVDLSKNLINDDVLEALLQLAKEAGVEEQRDRMFAGEHINTSEDRAVLHTALRNFGDSPSLAPTSNEAGVSEVQEVLSHMEKFTEQIRSGEWKGFTGKPITAIVNIGIGGSDLGPSMVVNALTPYTQRSLRAFFVSNIDGTHIAETLRECDAETTLFVIASKTFTTQETMENAGTAKAWFIAAAASKLSDAKKAEDAVSKHFVAVSTNTSSVTQFGISPSNMFPFWDWVGGRYSLWSSIGLSIALMVGYPNFRQLLEGAHGMDLHFKQTKLEDNIPILLGLLGVWYGDFWGAQSVAVLPYDQYMSRFAEYFQQADMESNGKSVTRGGERVNYQTGPILWGASGTNGQHSFYQLLHQGTKLVPADFLAPCTSHNAPRADDPTLHHRILLSNFFAQTEALAFGKSEVEVREELGIKEGSGDTQKEALVKSKVFEGNRPSTSVMFPLMTPATLGALISMYEHKIFTQGVVWGVNSFDQMGVELGKVLAKNILKQLGKPEDVKGHDSSTAGLIHYYQKFRKE
ncbi:glucose-6-phosphate isomerase [Crepidotus variabilis]|uniref:Glucose-6-phosphate isomerase n=1 Tax=Crepidotus variabilis TaxID=179855 RepID=A0A9P6E9F3_9AGAR|nr:glucose-6-phosphate isomerase [Crepidotus variabilis]